MAPIATLVRMMGSARRQSVRIHVTQSKVGGAAGGHSRNEPFAQQLQALQPRCHHNAHGSLAHVAFFTTRASCMMCQCPMSCLSKLDLSLSRILGTLTCIKHAVSSHNITLDLGPQSTHGSSMCLSFAPSTNQSLRTGRSRRVELVFSGSIPECLVRTQTISWPPS
jgi:hypothetical protein